MHQARRQPRAQTSFFTLFVISVIYSTLICLVSYKSKNCEGVSARCSAELTDLKYQYDNVVAYKKSMDSVISTIQQENNVMKQSLKEFYNSYSLMKRHLEICEEQTEDLEAECKSLKQKLHQAETELVACKKAPG